MKGRGEEEERVGGREREPECVFAGVGEMSEDNPWELVFSFHCVGSRH